jgi:hypothetical protein
VIRQFYERGAEMEELLIFAEEWGAPGDLDELRGFD